MKGTISTINQRCGMVAVKTAEGSYSILNSLAVMRLILGDVILKNKTQGASFQVYFQNHHVNQSTLSNQLRI